MGVLLKERINGDGTTTLYLSCFSKDRNPKRWTEFLTGIKLTTKPTTLLDREENKRNRDIAKRIALRTAAKLTSKKYNVETEENEKIIVLDWMKDYAKRYNKADIRVINAVINQFEKFLKEKKSLGLMMRDFNSSTAKQFKEKLERECAGEGARSYWNRFKKLLRQAHEDDLLAKNPCIGVKPPEGKAREKDTLTPEELQVLAQTPTDATETKRAFLFCANTGLRGVDVCALTWGSINLKEREIRFEQSKTGVVAVVSLNKTAIELLGKEKGKKELVFPDLPTTTNGRNKGLKLWVKRAGIEKRITFHCARHSLGTNLIAAGAEVYTVSKQLGHTSLTHTLKYLRESKELKQKAVDSLPEINLNSRIVEEGNTFEIIKAAPLSAVKKNAKKKELNY